MRTLLLLLLAIFAGACYPRHQNPARGELVGLYSRGLEANHFVECDSVGADHRPWLVSIDSAQARRFKAEDSAPGAFHDAVYLVVWRAAYHVSPPPSPPRMGPQGPRWLEVSEVVSVRAPRAGECGYVTPRP